MLARVQTARLDLQPVSFDDLDALFALNNDERTWTYDPAGRHLGPDRTRAWITRCVEKWRLDDLSYWTVRLLSSGSVIGVGGVQSQPFGWNLYYRFTPSSWGNGYATELAQAALAAASSHDPGAPVMAWISPANPASARVATRLGLTDQGLHPDPTQPAGTMAHAYSTHPYP